ncbi:MAG: arginine--tRNA ligase [Chloroflexota bacterium]|nr:arginine--tRNA ligase [Chloroflexota bacterium]
MIRDEISQLIEEAIEEAQQSGALPQFDVPEVAVEHPRDPVHGDYATPVCLQMARLAHMPPMEIAQTVVEYLPQADFIGQVEVAHPGFINFTLSEEWLVNQVEAILSAGERWGELDLGRGRKAQVEFVSANPTGPLTVGRTWGAVLGDTIANVLTAVGYDVTREYYFNNAGRQMRLLGESVRARYRELLGQPAEMPEEGYQGDYIWEIARDIVEEEGEALLEADWEPFKERAEEWVFRDIRATLDRFGLRFDVFYNENSLYESGRVDRAIEGLKRKGYAYEEEGALWFRAEQFGAEKDRVLVKSTGEPTYRLPDIAYHVHKLQRGFERIVDIFGADHHATWPDVVAGVRALGHDTSGIEVIIHQFISLIKDGQPVKMSTRAGEFVTLDELLDMVTTGSIPGKDVVRFMLLTRSPDRSMVFDLDLAVKQSDENPVYYVQYAHARIASILRFAEERGVDSSDGDVGLLTHPSELALIRRMLLLPEIVERAALDLAPHHLTYYAQDLASAFHAFYRDCRVVSSDPADAELTRARLKLVRAAKTVLARTLHLMGMTAPDKM